MTAVARWLAVAIAVVAVVDPAVDRERPVRAEVSVLAAPGAEAAAGRLADALASSFDILRAPAPTAAATVLAGVTLPRQAAELTRPAIVVRPERPVEARLAAVAVADQVSVHAEGSIEVAVDVAEGAEPVTVALQYGGIRVDQLDIETAGHHVVPLAFLPVRTGPAALRVTLVDAANAPLATADIATDVVDRTWRVLFHDARPSWMSTFVRRALEGDARFDIATRVSTSRDVSVQIGRAPRSLAGWTTFDDFDVVVIGAPETIDAADVAALDAFARQRGGTVILPMDRLAPGRHDAWLHVGRWDALASPGTLTVRSIQGPAFDAAELAWPQTLPAGADVLATVDTPADQAAPVIWRLPTGAGAVVVSGAMDAWRFRADADDFGAFWRATIADAAARAMPPLSLTPAVALARPGERQTVTAAIRDAALGGSRRDATVRIRATMAPDASALELAVHPSATPGLVHIPVVAPATPGTYPIVVTHGTHTATATLMVASAVGRPNPDETALAAAWAASRGGRVIDGVDAAAVRSALDDAIARPMATGRWHPMRSPWWIAPFAACLGIEWWSRRRRGLA